MHSLVCVFCMDKMLFRQNGSIFTLRLKYGRCCFAFCAAQDKKYIFSKIPTGDEKSSLLRQQSGNTGEKANKTKNIPVFKAWRLPIVLFLYIRQKTDNKFIG